MPGEGTRQMEVARLLEPGPCLTIAQMTESAGCTRRDIAEACGKLVRRGWVDRLERGCFVLSPDGRRALAAGETITSGARRPRSVVRRVRHRTVRDKMWSAIRITRKFDLAHLEQMTGASYAGACRYVSALARAGVLAELQRRPGDAPTSPGHKRWLLVDNLGPLTPQVRADGRVWDPNRNKDLGGAP